MPQKECLQCLIEITKKAINLSTEDKEEQKKLLQNLKKQIKRDFNQLKLPDYSTKIFKIIAEETKTVDPFLEIKKESNERFLEIIPQIEQSLSDLENKALFKKLFLFSIAANMVDFSTGGHSVDLLKISDEILEFPKQGLTIDNFEELYNAILNSNKIIYLSDNCGEVVIDNLIVSYLVNNLDKEVYLGLKGAPVANDCSLDDFTRDKIPFKATETFIVSNSFGYNLHQVSDQFKKLLDEADLLIVKGQSNYETTLNNLIRYPDYNFPPLFCVLRTKCPVISKHLGVKLGSNVIKQMHPLTKKKQKELTEIVDC